MNKKSMEIGAILTYALTAVIVMMILYFGYKGISGFYKAREDSLLQNTKLQIKADMSNIVLQYDSIATFQYEMPAKFSKLCFVDLFVTEGDKAIRDNSMDSYPIIKDSVLSDTSQNSFFAGESTEPFDVGKIRVSCEPYFVCFEKQGNRVLFRATGKGTYVLISNSSGEFC
ncbi:hypothetical protein KY308_03225 [Candidatus Woesearchaeota archaeon]|nr:hypothetical protein [Candidatus Woesearchaeota archaeon]